MNDEDDIEDELPEGEGGCLSTRSVISSNRPNDRPRMAEFLGSLPTQHFHFEVRTTRTAGEQAQIAALWKVAWDNCGLPLQCPGPRFRGITGRCIMRIKNENLEFNCFRGQ
jgi:hypothetical protein